MLNTAVILLIESAINRTLQTDDVTCRALEEISGAVIEVIIEETNLHFYIIPHKAGLHIQSTFLGNADTSLSGSVENMLQLLTRKDKAEQLFGNGVTITGNNQLLTQFQRILSHSEIDWPALFSPFVGDLIAQYLTDKFSNKASNIKRIGQSVQLNLAEYLQEEARWLPAGPEVEHFLTTVNTLQLTADRLEARMNLFDASLLQSEKS